MDFDDDDDGADPALPAFAMAVGSLCQAWAELEYAALLLLAVLTEMPRNQDTLSILRCFEFRSQLAAIKVAVVATQKNLVIVDHVVEAVDHIDAALRPRRNRLVHDRWAEIGDPVTAHRITETPRVRRTQAFQPREVTWREQTPETFLSIQTTVHEVAAYTDHLYGAVAALAKPGEASLQELTATRPPRPFPPPKWGRSAEAKPDAR